MADKPPAQVAGVAGIAATPVTIHQPPTVDWARVVELPPFQMFVAEVAGANFALRNDELDALANAQAYVQSLGFSHALLDDYVRWHGKKGYWPNESALGASN